MLKFMRDNDDGIAEILSRRDGNSHPRRIRHQAAWTSTIGRAAGRTKQHPLYYKAKRREANRVARRARKVNIHNRKAR